MLLSEWVGSDNAPGAARGTVFSLLWRSGWGLPLLSKRALSWAEKVSSTGVRRWLSFRRGGELRAWLRRSSVSRSLASSASSSCVWVETACFLGERSAGAMRGRRRRRSAGDALLMNRLVEQINAAIEPEEVVEL